MENKKKDIEIEYMGKLDEEKFLELKEKLEKQGEFKKKKERVSFVYFRDEIPEDMSDYEDDTDLRLRITNKKPEIILKKGQFTGSHSRKEISIDFPIEETQKYIDFLSALGWNIGVIYATESFVYDYKDVEISLVKIEDYGYNFEVEVLTSEEEKDEAKEKINKVLDEFELKPFKEEDLMKQCNDINHREGFRFDFSKQNFEEFKEKFSRFF